VTTTPQERFALSVAALLLAAGIGVRLVSAPPSPAEWLGEESVAGAVADGPRAQVEQEVANAARARTPLSTGERLDPNTATAVELQRLPRVGPRLAGRIIEHREANGPFRTLQDLDAVPGIGPAMLEAITPHVSLPAAPSRAAAPPRAAMAAAPAASGVISGPLDLNRASVEELTRLPGIGPVLANRIVEWREGNGRFRTVAELERVPGIGPRMMERLTPLLQVVP
jgi:competence protein ComEA